MSLWGHSERYVCIICQCCPCWISPMPRSSLMSWKQKLRRADAGCQHETWKRVLRGTTSAFVLPLCRTRTWINWPGLSGRPFASLTVFLALNVQADKQTVSRCGSRLSCMVAQSGRFLRMMRILMETIISSRGPQDVTFRISSEHAGEGGLQ